MKTAPNKIFQNAYGDTPPGRKVNNLQEVHGSAGPTLKIGHSWPPRLVSLRISVRGKCLTGTMRWIEKIKAALKGALNGTVAFHGPATNGVSTPFLPQRRKDATAGQGYNPSSKQRRIQPAPASSATAPTSAKSPPAPPAQVQRFQNVTEWRLLSRPDPSLSAGFLGSFSQNQSWASKFPLLFSPG